MSRKEQLEQRLKEHRLQNRFHQAAAQARQRLEKKSPGSPAKAKSSPNSPTGSASK